MSFTGNRADALALDVRALSKKFGSFTAVDQLSFRVDQGEIFGLLGANGAGKSTTIRMLCGLLRPSAGEAIVAGANVGKQPETVKRRIGYMSQRFSLYHDLTVTENIRFYGGVYGLNPDQIEERKRWALSMAGLEKQKTTLTAELAGGYKQRLALGCSLLHRPQVVFLDEPTGGVDPASRRSFWALINDLAEHGTTVIVTTHYLDEAEYCNNILLMHAGRAVAQGSPSDLKNEAVAGTLSEIRCDNPLAGIEALKPQPWVTDIAVFGAGLHIWTERDETARISRVLANAGCNVTSVEPATPSLEDVFIRLTTTNQETHAQAAEGNA